MKKSLVALAVLGAAASAQAADISLYGVVDTGLAYTYQDNWGIADNTVAHTTDGESSLEMASGINASSRFGIVGSEDAKSIKKHTAFQSFRTGVFSREPLASLL